MKFLKDYQLFKNANKKFIDVYTNSMFYEK